MSSVCGPLLVTGFRPFLGETVNPSQEILAQIDGESGVRTLLLPVAFEDSVTELKKFIERHAVSGLLMLGQASGRSKISLERVALNWIETTHPDEVGVKPMTGEIVRLGAPAIFSTLPLDDWRVRLEEAGIPAEVSLSAGGYVCNHLLYRAATIFPNLPLLFTHVPSLPEQSRLQKPSLTLDQMTTAVRILIREFRELGSLVTIVTP